MHRDAVFMSSRFLTASVSQGTLFCSLVGMHSAVASIWALTKFSYLSFLLGVSDISCNALNLFLSVIIYIYC